ncbi:MAG: hypothetical protein GY694_03780 [Gammaproteobacteria bacterium]|nr:hypothetical protein [Gammaproteobacteria bacterium]
MIKEAFAVCVLAFCVCYVYLDMDFPYHFNTHHPGVCKVLDTRGSEDIHVTASGQAFITSGGKTNAGSYKVQDFFKDNNIKGRILLYNFRDAEQEVVSLKIITDGTTGFDLDNFYPHGISVLEDKVKGEHLVYVINHPSEKSDAVEKFRFFPKTHELVHLRSITDAMLWTTNDLAVVSEDHFYISNWLYSTYNLVISVEVLLALPIHALLYYNGSQFTEVASGLSMPDGVHVSSDGTHVYVANSRPRQVLVYEVKADHSLHLVQRVQLTCSPDNLSQSEDDLLVGCVTLMYRALGALDDPKKKAPSRILKLPLEKGLIQSESISELFYDQSDLISFASVGVAYNNSLLIGSVCENLVLCQPDGQLR